MYLCMKLDLIEICLKDMWWVIPSASPDRRHLRDVPSPATGTQGYQIHVPLPVGICNCIAHLPPVKAKPLRGGWVCVLARRCRLRKSRDINFEKTGRSGFSLALDQGPGCCQKLWSDLACLAQTLHPLSVAAISDGLEKLVWHKFSIPLSASPKPMVWQMQNVLMNSIYREKQSYPMDASGRSAQIGSNQKGILSVWM